MSSRLITENVWKHITAASKKCKQRAYVAVAYVGKNADSQLPLPKNSCLVVDASEHAVRSGQTCPDELIKMTKRGVSIFNVPNLHAKVFVFGKKAFIGSANVSGHSKNVLIETVVETTDDTVVNSAREFILEMCHDELGPEALQHLVKLYKPPKYSGGQNQLKKTVSTSYVVSELPIRIVNLDLGDDPIGSEQAYEEGRQIAESKMLHEQTHYLDSFRWSRDIIKKGEMIVQVTDEGNKRVLVSPPGRVLNTKNWSNGRKHCTFVYLEVPDRKRITLDKLAKRLGKNSKKEMKRDHKVKGAFARKIREAWNI